MTDLHNSSGITKNGLVRLLSLYRYGEESQECQSDLDKIIQEMRISDPVERNFCGSYSDNEGVFVVSVQIVKDGNNRYSLKYKHYRP